MPSPAYPGAMKGVPVELLPLLTTALTTGVAIGIPITNKNARVHIRGAGVIASGTIIIEESYDPEYTGLWSQIITVLAVGLTGGQEQVIHIASTIGVIRLRVSVVIAGGGSVSAVLITD